MNKKKLRMILFSLPFIILGLSILFRIIYNAQDLLWIYSGDWLIPFLEILSSLGIYLAYGFFFTSPILLGLGLYLMIKYRDRKKIDLSLKINKKNIIKVILITLAILTFSFVFHLFLLSRVLKYLPYGLQDNPIQYNRIEKIKKDLLMVIPDKYEIIESKFEEPSEENDGCIFLYSIYPKEYSEIEKEYLNNAELIYCEDINTAVLKGQVEDVRYNQTIEKWVRIQGDSEVPLDVKQYGENLVSIVDLGGSHASSNYYIVSVEDSLELVILSVPRFHRIRCEEYDENGVETMKEDCIEFITSMGMRADSSESVPYKIYEDYYKDLLVILKDI